MIKLDKRRHAFRADLADINLKGQVTSDTFVQSVEMVVVAPTMSLRSAPQITNGFTSQALLGDGVDVFEQKDGWAWVQLKKDGYVGYVEQSGLATPSSTPTHRVVAPSTFIYPQADLKSQPAIRIFMNSSLAIVSNTVDWCELAQGGYVYGAHIEKIDTIFNDPVAVAEKFLNSPYLWGGNTQDGLDCSALVQEAYHACGLECPRDSDMIESEVGETGHNSMQRGDLVFWDGHIGMIVDDKNMIHANGHHMAVVKEEFAQAEERINKIYGSNARFKRP